MAWIWSRVLFIISCCFNICSKILFWRSKSLSTFVLLSIGVVLKNKNKYIELYHHLHSNSIGFFVEMNMFSIVFLKLNNIATIRSDARYLFEAFHVRKQFLKNKHTFIVLKWSINCYARHTLLLSNFVTLSHSTTLPPTHSFYHPPKTILLSCSLQTLIHSVTTITTHIHSLQHSISNTHSVTNTYIHYHSKHLYFAGIIS